MTLAEPLCDSFTTAITETMKDVKRLQSWPLRMKIEHSKQVIREFYDYMNGLVSVSFSGGLDSTVLLHLVRSLYPETPAIFYDTGLEFPEIRDFVRTHENVEFIHATDRKGERITFKNVIDRYGYPVIGKEVCRKVVDVRNGSTVATRFFDGTETGRYDYRKYAYLLDAPFKISEYCCNVLKKTPSKKYFKKTGRGQYIGTRNDESQRRKTSYELLGENRYGKEPKSNPLSIWTREDVKEYIRLNNLEYCVLYDRGYERTGCMFCMFGAHLEDTPNRFQIMKRTHPKQWLYCMKPTDKGGLGLAEVLEYIGVPTGENQSMINDFMEE